MGLDINITTKKHDNDFRKHNYLFRWVENRVGDIENEQTYYLEKQDIQDLLDSINEVLDDHSKAEDVLPTQSGFFFGSTEYDEGYFEDLEYAKDKLSAMIDDWEDGEQAEFWACPRMPSKGGIFIFSFFGFQLRLSP